MATKPLRHTPHGARVVGKWIGPHSSGVLPTVAAAKGFGMDRAIPAANAPPPSGEPQGPQASRDSGGDDNDHDEWRP
jgi:hypothetical protein